MPQAFFAGPPPPLLLQGFDFMSLDDGMRSKEYHEALLKFNEMEGDAMERGYWLPENQGEDEKRVRQCMSMCMASVERQPG